MGSELEPENWTRPDQKPETGGQKLEAEARGRKPEARGRRPEARGQSWRQEPEAGLEAKEDYVKRGGPQPGRLTRDSQVVSLEIPRFPVHFFGKKYGKIVKICFLDSRDQNKILKFSSFFTCPVLPI